MEVDRVTLIEPGGDVRYSLSTVAVRSVAGSKRSLVLEAPRDALERTALGEGSGTEAGHSIVVTTTEGRTYSGYVEVVVDADDTRFFWCSVRP